MNIVNSKSNRSNTGYKGISFVKKRNKFETKLQFTTKGGNENKAFIGYFNTIEEAIEARKQFILNLF